MCGYGKPDFIKFPKKVFEICLEIYFRPVSS